MLQELSLYNYCTLFSGHPVDCISCSIAEKNQRSRTICSEQKMPNLVPRFPFIVWLQSRSKNYLHVFHVRDKIKTMVKQDLSMIHSASPQSRSAILKYLDGRMDNSCEYNDHGRTDRQPV